MPPYEFDGYLQDIVTEETASVRTQEPEKQLLYGEDVRSNPPPEHTAAYGGGLRTVFQDPWGRRFGLNAQALSKHLLLLGGIGSGKTNVFNFLIESLLEQQTDDDILFIFDTKGDFFRRFYQSYNPAHMVIGNGAAYEELSHCWNVFGELEDGQGRFTRTGEFTAKEIGKQLFAGRGSDTQPFFGLAAADLVSKVLIDFERRAMETGDRSRLNNAALTSWFQRADLTAWTDLIGRNPDFASAMLYFGDPGQGGQQKLTAQALGVFGYINAMCSDLFTGVFAEDRPGQAFSMRALVRGRHGRVVFIEYDLSAGEVLGPIYRLLIDLALKEALGQNGRRKGNVFLLADEFKLLPDLMHIDDALNFGRSLGVKVFAGLQSIDQIYAGYGEERGKAILSGFMNSFCFQTPDSHSRKYIMERFGENCCQLTYRTRNEPVSIQREGHAVEDWDILNLAIGQAAVDLVGEKPFLFQFSDFDGNREQTG